MDKLKLAKNAAKLLAKAAVSHGAVDTVVNTAIRKVGKYAGYKTAEECIDLGEQKHYLIIQGRTFSSASFSGLSNGTAKGSISYCVYDRNRQQKYNVKDMISMSSTLLMETTHYGVFNMSNKKIGSIKKDLVSISNPFERKASKCHVFIGEKHAYNIKTSISKLAEGSKTYREFRDGKKHNFKIDEIGMHKKMHIETGIGKVELVEYKLYSGNTELAHIYSMPPQLNNEYSDRYVIGYNDLKNEHLSLILSIAICLIT